MKLLNFLIIINLIWLNSSQFYVLESTESQNTSWRTKVCNANPQHAKGFKVNCSGKTVHLEFFLPNQQTSSIEIVRLGQKVSKAQLEIPLQTYISLSATHISHLRKLSVLDKLQAVARIEDITDQELLNQAELGLLTEVGMIHNLNMESIVEIQPEVVFAYYSQNFESQSKQLIKAGIKILHINEFLESTPLAYAEWIKLFGILFDRVEIANSKFDIMKSQYESISRRARAKQQQQPTVLLNVPYGDTWFVPAGENFMAHLLRDAGADYIFSHIEGNYNLRMSIEAVIEAGLESDFWLNPSLHTHKTSLIKADPRFAAFKAFRKNKVFNNTKALLENKTNDYFSEALANPHLLLADLVQIFHPELLPNRSLRWFHPLLD